MMEVDDIFMFCQNELPYNSFIAFEDMRKKGQFCDLTIKVQNHSFIAHRMILAAGIPYFNSLFTNDTVDIDENELTDADLDPRAFESLIHFAYTSKVNITMENVNSLLVASHFLQLNQVIEACVEFISKRLLIDTVLKVRTLASGINNLKLIDNCDQYILKNFEEFSKCDDFSSLPHSCFKEIIAEDNLNVSCEEVVFDAVIKWSKASPSERHVSLPELLNEVRWIYLPLDYLVNRVDCEDLILTSRACMSLINAAKSYYLLPEKRPALSNLKMRARNYRQDFFAVCSCETSGYSVHHLVNDTWLPWSSKRVQCNNTVRCVVGVKDKIYIFFKEGVETFCIPTHEWERLTTTPTDIVGAAVVPYEDKIYFFGSFYSDSNKKVLCFDAELNQWLREVEIMIPLCDSAGASWNEYIYVTGGYINKNYLDDVVKYNPLTGHRSYVASMLTHRAYHGCVALSEKIYVCGGQTIGNNALSTAEVYDSITSQWNHISPMATAKYSFTFISHRNKIYALDDESAVEAYDPKHNDWKGCVNVPQGFKGAVLGRSYCTLSHSA